MEREIPKKNYIFLILICTFSIVLALYIMKWHSLYMDNNLELPILSNYVSENLKYDEFENFIQERGKRIIYLGASNDEECREFEKEFRSIIIKYNLKEELTYLDLKENKDEYLQKFNTKYLTTLTLPSLVVMEDANVLDKLELKDINMEIVVSFLESHGVISD